MIKITQPDFNAEVKKKLKIIKANLTLYRSYVRDKQHETFFSTLDEYLAFEAGKREKKSKFQMQFNLTKNELDDLQRRLKNLLELNTILIKTFNLDKYGQFKISLKELFIFNLNFYKESKGQDYLRGMYVTLTHSLYRIEQIDKEIENKEICQN